MCPNALLYERTYGWNSLWQCGDNCRGTGHCVHMQDFVPLTITLASNQVNIILHNESTFDPAI